MDYLAAKGPIPVFDGDETTASFIISRGAVLTPWGQEIVFLVDRKKNGYLTAFGGKTSVNGMDDPSKVEGFKYSKAVGITLKTRPDFIDAESLIITLDDNTFNKVKDSVLKRK